jgi:hypothetical protein
MGSPQKWAVDVKILAHFIERCRLTTMRNATIFYPILFSQYHDQKATVRLKLSKSRSFY